MRDADDINHIPCNDCMQGLPTEGITGLGVVVCKDAKWGTIDRPGRERNIMVTERALQMVTSKRHKKDKSNTTCDVCFSTNILNKKGIRPLQLTPFQEYSRVYLFIF